MPGPPQQLRLVPGAVICRIFAATGQRRCGRFEAVAPYTFSQIANFVLFERTFFFVSVTVVFYPPIWRARHLAAYGNTNIYRPVNNMKKRGGSGE